MFFQTSYMNNYLQDGLQATALSRDPLVLNYFALH